MGTEIAYRGVDRIAKGGTGGVPACRVEQHGGFRERLLGGKIAVGMIRSVKAVGAEELHGTPGDPQS